MVLAYQHQRESMKKTIIGALSAMLMVSTLTAFGSSFPKAEMLNNNGLTKESQAELIDLIFSTAADMEKAKAYYLLGSISFKENKISTALNTWRQLLSKYPTSKEALLVKDRIKELAEIVGEAEKESVENSIAQLYLSHGDFWSRGKDNKFTIDTSWIPNVESAIFWYDKVIKEYPNSAASRIAYEEKMRTLLGWKEAGEYGESHGLKKSFESYMAQLIDTFSSFEKEYPSASTLQAFRYQIAQAYWRQKDWTNTRGWLNKIVENAGDADSFYKSTALGRLKKVEH
jgi:tetratricopeptide (TPR) repeat protein